MYFFSIGAMFFGYFINEQFANAAISSNTNYTYSALKTLANTFAINQSINTALIFGDFIAGLEVLFSILTGGTIAAALTGIPFVSADVLLLIQITFALSSVAMWILIVANRDM